AAAKTDANSANSSFGGVGGNTEIFRVEAEGHVTLKRDTQTVVGDHAIYDVDKATAVVTGKNLKMTTAQDVVTARDSLEWFDQKQIAVARGNAIAIRNGKTIKGDILTAYMVKTAAPGAKPAASAAPGGHPARGKPGAPAPAAPGKPAAPSMPGSTKPGEESKISRVDAQGHVVVTNGTDVGRGDFGVYNADTGIATLIRNVVIERGKDVIRGQRGVIDLNNNISRMLPGGGPETAPQRVQGLFVREQRSGTPGAANSPPGSAPGSAPGTNAPSTSAAPKKP
ncbi:MAG TPA: LptA/OstA family protein, partial [Burkholderiales bacterium]